MVCNKSEGRLLWFSNTTSPWSLSKASSRLSPLKELFATNLKIVCNKSDQLPLIFVEIFAIINIKKLFATNLKKPPPVGRSAFVQRKAPASPSCMPPPWWVCLWRGIGQKIIIIILIFQPLPCHLVLTSAALFAVGDHQTAHAAPRFLEKTNFRYHFDQDD